MNSISQKNNNYVNICKLAASNDSVFETFKRNRHYTEILEHTTYENGLLYLNNIKTNFPDYIKYINKFKINDSLGGSVVYDYPDIGLISPSSLRYIKVVSDIINIFQDLNNKTIIEIGCGYGGQCFMLNQVFKFKTYYIVDIPETQSLINKYLTKLNINFQLITIDELINNKNIEYDLVISNYAYSELSKDLQNFYYENIIKQSKNGYFTLNFISHLFNIESHTKDSLICLFNKQHMCKLLKEDPETFNDNLILYF